MALRLPPATASPPKKVTSSVHSIPIGTCQPLGHNLPVYTAYQIISVYSRVSSNDFFVYTILGVTEEVKKSRMQMCSIPS